MKQLERGEASVVGDQRQDGHQPALPVKLLAEAVAHAAQHGCQQLLIAHAELRVLQCVLQKPKHTNTHNSY